MTRQTPVGRLRTGSRSHDRKMNPDGRPRPGSKLRATYDDLRRGKRVVLSDLRTPLQDYYGMVLQSNHHGSVLLGEWAGDDYVPIEEIMIETMAADAAEAPRSPKSPV